jgi:O-antigen ligase/tetratricopeptide (TPR) repeat protein
MHTRRAGVVVFEHADLTREQFDQPIFWLLSALLGFMPAYFGGWDPWTECLALTAALVLAAMLALKLARRPDVPFVWSWTYLPIAAFFLLIFAQLIPLPASVVDSISPQTVKTRQWLLGNLPDAAARLQQMRFSFYPEGTWHDLRNLCMVVAIFVVVINIFREATQMKRLLWVIAWIGAAEGLLAILQIVTSAPGIYWLYPLWGNARPEAGTYPNHNVFSQFMNLSSGAMLGLLLLKLDETFRRNDYAPAEVMEKLTAKEFRWAYVLVAMLVIAVASVFLSLSRGGMLSIGIAGTVVGFLLMLRGGARGVGVGGWVAGFIIVIAFAVVMAGGSKLVEARIAKIGSNDDRYDRFQLTRDTFRAWQDYPIIGSGLGTFRWVFPRYDRSSVTAIASHAEDEYVQLLLETGVVGASIVAAFILLIAAAFMGARAHRRKNPASDEPSRWQSRLSAAQAADESLNISSAESADELLESADADAEAPLLAAASPLKRHRSNRKHGHRSKTLASPASSLSLGLCYGLVAILVQSASDFGQHCSSVAVLTAVSCALMLNLAALRARKDAVSRLEKKVLAARAFRFAGLLAVCALAVPLIYQAYLAYEGASASDLQRHIAGELAQRNWKGDPGEMTDMIRASDRAIAFCPNDIRYHFWRAMDRSDPLFATAPVDPVSLSPLFDAQQLAELRGLAADLEAARYLCPTFGMLYAQLGQWYRSVLDRPDYGAELIRMAYVLEPQNDTVCWIAGTLDLDERRWADSIRHYREALKLQPNFAGEILDLYIAYAHRPDIALEFASQDVSLLHQLASKLRAKGRDPAAAPTTAPATQPADEAIALAAEARVSDVARAEADKPDASPATIAEMGRVSLQDKNYPEAVKYLGRAVLHEYSNADWHSEYARALKEVGRRDDALHEAKTTLRLNPTDQSARDLVDELTAPSTQTIEELSK